MTRADHRARTSPWCVAICATAYAVLAAQAPAQSARVVRRHDLSAIGELARLVDHDPGAATAPQRLLLGERAARFQNDADPAVSAALSWPAVLAVVRSAIAMPLGGEAECTSFIDETTSALLVSATPAEHLRVAQVLTALAEALAGTADVDVVEVDAAVLRSTSSSVLSPDAASAAFQHAPPRAHSITVRDGAFAAVDDVVRQARLSGYDTDRNNAAIGADPTVTVDVEGLRGAVRVRPLADGRLAVDARIGSPRQLAPTRTHPVHFAADGVLELPTTAWDHATASGVIENGGALLLGSSRRDRGAWLVRVRHSPPPPRSRLGNVEFIPVGLLTLNGLDHDEVISMSIGGSGSPNGSVEQVPTLASTPVDPAHLEQAALRPLRSNEERLDDRACFACGPNLIVIGDDETRAFAREVVKERLGDARRTVTIEMRAGVIEAGTPAPSSSTELARLAEALPVLLRTCGRPHDRVAVASLDVTAYLKDHDSEIAQRATIAVPIVDTVPSGISARFVAAPGFSGSWIVDWSIGFGALASLMTVVPAGDRCIETIEVPETTAVEGHGTARMELARWHLLRWATLAGGPRVFVALVRISE